MNAMKRSRADMEVETLAMANCLMLLTRVGKSSSEQDRVFECKTCNKKFSSFQALGGHRASHKRPKLMGGDLLHLVESPSKPKTHECSICGQEFPMGQALGGHMRRHRLSYNQDSTSSAIKPLEKQKIPVLEKCNSRRNLISLDLNLTPYENELKLENIAPVLNCF